MNGRRIAIEDLLSFRWVADVALSPDGRTVAYTHEVIARPSGGAGDGPSHEYHAHIWLADTDEGTPRSFTTGPHRDRRPLWSPDSGSVLFVSDRGAPASAGAKPPKHLWIIRLAGGGNHRPSASSSISGTGRPAASILRWVSSTGYGTRWSVTVGPAVSRTA